jgi:hypothetical protein
VTSSVPVCPTSAVFSAPSWVTKASLSMVPCAIVASLPMFVLAD